MPPMLLGQHATLAHLGEADRATLCTYLETLRFAAGERVIGEGAGDRSLYLVLHGDARVERRGLDLSDIGPGEHVGELALLAPRHRAASVTAATELEVARLTAERYEALCADHPALALDFTRALISGLGDRLTDVTDSVGVLLQERSLPRRTLVDVRMAGERRRVRTGTTARELLPATVHDQLVVAALLDRRQVALTTPITSSCELEPLTIGHWEGKRVYRKSLALLLLEAARSLGLELTIDIDYSLGFAQRIRARGTGAANRRTLARALEARMIELADAALPVRQEWWTVDEAIDHFAEAGARGTVALLRTWRQRAVLVVGLGETRALYTGPLTPETSMLRGFRVVSDGDGLLLVYGRGGTEPRTGDLPVVRDARAASRHTRQMTREQDRWLETLQISTVGEFNQRCLHGDVATVIRVAEGFHEKRVGQIADEVRDAGRQLKVVCISGPSSAGKTTFIKRLKTQLQVNGIHPVELSLDDYYVDRDATPRDELGNFDFETLDALRLDLLQEHLTALLRGATVRTARFDFRTGTSHPSGGHELALGDAALLMLEGIHGLNPRLVSALDPSSVFRIFVCPLAQLPIDSVTRVHASDLRLLRRIVRDRHRRDTGATENIARWPSVRRGERGHIYPFQDNADAVFDSSLIYELSVLKVYAERYLLEVAQDRIEYATANRLLHVLDAFVTIYPDHVPPTSILREFIGGSGFEY